MKLLLLNSKIFRNFNKVITDKNIIIKKYNYSNTINFKDEENYFNILGETCYDFIVIRSSIYELMINTFNKKNIEKKISKYLLAILKDFRKLKNIKKYIIENVPIHIHINNTFYYGMENCLIDIKYFYISQILYLDHFKYEEKNSKLYWDIFKIKIKYY